MHRLIILILAMACAPGKSVTGYVQALIPEEDALELGEPSSDSGTDEEEAAVEPSEEPSAEPASEPSEEETPATLFSAYIEDELGLERDSTGLNALNDHVTLWLDASDVDSMVVDSDGHVSRWISRTSNQSVAVQNSVDNQPIHQQSDGMLNFNGNQYFMVDGQFVDIDTSYFAIYKGLQPSGTLFAKAAEFGNWSRGGKTFFIRNGRYTTDVGWVGYLESSQPVPVGPASIAMFEHVENANNDTHRIFQNGLEQASRNWNYNNHAESSLDGGGIFKIGFTSDDFPQSHGLYGKIGEIIKIDQALSDVHRAMIFAYLAIKWDIVDQVDSDGDGTIDSMDPNPIDPSQ